eukprot:3634434-Ditylum_brightwellii.AAC.1
MPWTARQVDSAQCNTLSCGTNSALLAHKPIHLLQFVTNPISNQVGIAAVRLRAQQTTHQCRFTRSQKARRESYKDT